ncbi:mannose/glucose-specific lectin-like [Cornus florida]|uniref:mannose/glucose-specific lectin-like n=1 Tax=Cornus florida TaxID=4283 RepID=UPI0028A06FEE|nr:mannose/glucose-specific lectin-like [Cornus florida]
METGQTVSFGPYGAPGGNWDDGKYSTIRELIIYTTDGEFSAIKVVYDNEGKEVSGKINGGFYRTPNSVKLNYPTEYLVSISGYCGYFKNSYLVVKSITIQSNIKQYGPYGKEEGSRFITPLTAGKIVGFFGRVGERMDNIGVHIKPFQITIPSVGPFGTTSGKQWEDKIYSTIREIIIHSGWLIDSIQVVYDIEGRALLGEKHGTDGGQETKVKLNYPTEYLVSISGYCGYFKNSYLVVKSITVQSNIKQYGPYGTEEGSRFITPLTAGKIVGFFGRVGERMDNIGVHIKPFQITIPSVGPFGTTSGKLWEDKIYSTIREIIIHSGWLIDSIQVVYDIEGRALLGEKHGTDGGQETKVKLNYPTEYLVSISGYCGYFKNSYLVVKSITVQSNIKQYGPYGKEEGSRFITPLTAGKIVGFFGRVGERMDNIGVHIKPFQITIPSVGPFGTTSGKQWEDKIYSTIREIIIHSGWLIDSIQVVYDIEGRALLGEKHGTDGGQETKVKLNYPTEYLVSISGYCGYYKNSYLVVKSITVQSNIKQYGPYGKEEGSRFITPLTAGKIVGFFGRVGERMDNIGVHIKPFQITIPSVGLFGTTSGKQWEDKIYSTIREIIIHSGWLIDSIQVVYDIEGRALLGEKHGTDGGQETKVTLDSDEYLITISGSFGEVDKKIVIRSLGFQSNKRMIGPFGTEEGEKFRSISSTCDKIIGFHGRSDKYLTSIGAYLGK